VAENTYSLILVKEFREPVGCVVLEKNQLK
jgi:hypothetical protein